MNTHIASIRQLVKMYVGYVGMFLGIGLISGSIVHLPIDPSRYSIIMVFGVVLFISATLVNEIILHKKEMSGLEIAKLLISSFLLSIGIGMMSGGIQHFEDVQEYAAYLIPIGLGISLFSFIVKNQMKLPKRKLAIVALSFVLIAAPLHLFLNGISDGSSGTDEVHSSHQHR